MSRPVAIGPPAAALPIFPPIAFLTAGRRCFRPQPLLPNSANFRHIGARNSTWLVGLVLLIFLAGCGGSADRAASIATEIGASDCTRTDYYIQSKLDGSKARIYDCTLHARQVCVTEQAGIARDETALARILFKQNLSGGQPDCAR